MYTQETKETIELLLSNRLFLYSLFHKVFGREPDEALFDALTLDACPQSFSLLSEEAGDSMEKAADFVSELRGRCHADGFLTEAYEEYMHLFIGPDKLIAPPWESVYRSKQGLLFQESTLTIREIYRQNGLIPGGFPRVADDSLALELDFMAHMAQKTLNLLETADEKRAAFEEALTVQESFVRVHLLFWIPKLLEKMSSSRSRIFYPQMTWILLEFLQKDHGVLNEILELVRE